MSQLKTLYPAIEAYATHSLEVDQQHTLYIEESGVPHGTPVLFVHGGPGGGCSPKHRQFFDPNKYRIILFDQRGSGKSKPHACLTNNTTAHLIKDIEKIREHLKIERWILFGGSWGSTLSLLYAQAHPKRLLGLILRGIFLCRKDDVDWLYQQGADRFFPEYWTDFIAPIQAENRHDMVNAYYEALTGEDELLRMRAAEAWSVWEGRISTLVTNPSVVDNFADPHHAIAMARIECHYFKHQAFIEPNQILQNVDVIQQIPTTIIHGRYDMVCPVNQAVALADALPNAELIIASQAGHSAFETELTHALVTTANRYAQLGVKL